MSKYEANTRKAEALQSVGESIESNIRWIKEEIESAEDLVRQLVAEDAEANQWSIDCHKSNIEKKKLIISFWEIAQKAIDKELMF